MAKFNIVDLIDFSPEQTERFQQVCATWGALLQNPVTINIQAQCLVFPAGLDHLEAMCVPNFKQGNYEGVNTTVTYAQARALDSGYIMPPPDHALDMVVLINSTYTFSYVDVETANTNFFTVCLHEICHGLGFVGLCNVDTTPNIGIFTDPKLLAALAPVQAYIPFWDNLETLEINYPTLFAQKFQGDVSGTFVYLDPPPTVYTYFVTEDSMAIRYQQSPSLPVEDYFIYTSDPFIPFTTCDHINYPVDCLMYYTVGTNVYMTPDFRTKNILSLIGWGLNNSMI